MLLHHAVNTLADFLARRDFPCMTRQSMLRHTGLDQCDVCVLFGGSILSGGDVMAAAISERVARTYVLVGGAGHTTPALRERMHALFPDVDTSAMPEAALFALYLDRVHGLKADHMETCSTNCGNNITCLLDLLASSGVPHQSMLLIQDGAMQRRMGLTLRKYAPDTRILHYAAYRACLTQDMQYQSPIKGMWDTERFISLLLGEVARIRDDENGYGPRGKNFIAHEEIPPQVESAFQFLTYHYAVRDANPAFRG